MSAKTGWGLLAELARLLKRHIRISVLALAAAGFAASPALAVPLACDVDGDTDIDRNDIIEVAVAAQTNLTVGPDDPRDPDQDGIVTVRDVRTCTLRCNLPGCAIPQQQQQLYFIYPDHLDTPRAITNQSGAAVWKWDNSEPFGNSLPNENPGGAGAFAFNLRFPGQYLDKETNLHYNYFRDYDPAIGRYVQSDPIGLLGGINTYTYANDPLAESDFFGQQAQRPSYRQRKGTGNPLLFPGSMSAADCKQICVWAGAVPFAVGHIALGPIADLNAVIGEGIMLADAVLIARGGWRCWQKCEEKTSMCTPFNPLPAGLQRPGHQSVRIE